MKETEKPVYQQVIDHLKEDIESKCANEPILSERELASFFSISRMTARKAVDHLVNEGYLYRIKNKGTFVADKTLYKTSTVYGEHENTTYKTLYFNVAVAGEEVASKLGISSDEMMVKIVRLSQYDGKAQTLDEIYFIKRYLSGEEIANISKIVDLKKCIDENPTEQSFYPIIVPIKYAALLGVTQGTPVINVQSIVRNYLGVPTLFFSSYLNPNQVTIHIQK